MIGNFPAVSNFNRLLLKLNRFAVTNCRFSPIIGQLLPVGGVVDFSLNLFGLAEGRKEQHMEVWAL